MPSFRRYHAAESFERIRAEQRLFPAHDLLGELECGPRVDGVYAPGVPENNRQASLGLGLYQLVVAHHEQRYVRLLRLTRLPGPCQPALLCSCRRHSLHTVTDHSDSVRHGHGHVVRGFVRRVIVARIPPPSVLGRAGADRAI